MNRPITRFLQHPIGLTLAIITVSLIAISLMYHFTTTPELHDGSRVTVKVDKAVIKADVAAKDDSRAKGLVGTDSLGEKEGMLFVFVTPHIPPFIMRGMNFPIDIIWINGDTVTEVSTNVQPQSADTDEKELVRYSPSAPVDKVVEVNAGWAASHSIQPGDPVRITR